jgi:predicted Zn-dependent protease with MMP-like domain
MATYYTLPLQPNAQVFTVPLSGVTYTLTFNYRDVPSWLATLADQGGWVMDIGDSQNNAIIQGIPLVTGANLLAQYAYLGFVGTLWVQTLSDPDAVPTYQNLGSDGLVFYVTVP